MKTTVLSFMIVCFACTTPKSATGANGARFIFRATVERIAAATLPEISDVSNCIVVKVNEVVSAPPGFTDWTGKSITVAVKDINRQKPETEKLFYTNGWLYGQSLAVVEVHSTESREVTNKEVLDGVAREQDGEIRERLKRSELVVSGVVSEIGETVGSNKVSEHNPVWTVASIKIDSIEKGNTSDPEIKVLYAKSGDIMWEESPKFKEGDRGIWLLRRSPNQDNTFTITDPRDYYPIERLEYIRSLLK